MENNEQKTPEDWFKLLKEPYRSEAIAQIISPERQISSLYDALYCCVSSRYKDLDFLLGSIKSGETTYLAEPEIRPENMISGEWYVVEAFEKKTYLIKFNKFHSNSLVWIKAFDIKSKYNCNELYIHKDYNIRSIRKATKEEVLEHFPNEFQEEKKEIHYSIYESLFNLIRQEHDVSLLPSEMEEIINECEKILEARKDEKQEVESEQECYFYSIDHVNYSTSDLHEALNDADNGTTINKAIPIGTKQTKSILEPINK